MEGFSAKFPYTSFWNKIFSLLADLAKQLHDLKTI
jgi:hypothetical protein